jgi:hypothetical protein
MFAIGDVVATRRRELVIVAPGQPGDSGAGLAEIGGSVVVCEASSNRQIVCGDPYDVPGGVTDLAVGDFIGGRRADIVVSKGTPGAEESFPGALYVFPTTSAGPGQRLTVTQNSRGVPGSDEPGDDFGRSLASADVNNDGKVDLAVGAPGENRGAGRVTLLQGNRSRLGTEGDRIVDQDKPGIAGRDERADHLGYDVSLLDVTGDRSPDLVVGVPGEGKNSGGLISLVNVDNRLSKRDSFRLGADDVGLSAMRLGEHVGQ